MKLQGKKERKKKYNQLHAAGSFFNARQMSGW
jgi:hypothetical protein